MISISRRSFTMFSLFGMVFSAHTASALTPNWQGKWSGECKGRQTFGINLTIGDTSKDAFDWILQYEGQPNRNYTMKKTDQENVYVLDENNGIFLTNFVFNNCLLDQFAVGNTKVSTKTCLEPTGKLTFEVSSSNMTPYSSSGTATTKVDDFRVFDFYACELSK